MLYTINRCNSTQNVILSTVLPELESLKLIIKHLNESQTAALTAKCALFDDFNFQNEDAEAHCITSINHLLRTVEPNILSTFYNATTADFPILKCLIKYSHHPDVMIRNAARLSLMSIFQKCRGPAKEYIVLEAIPNYISDILSRVKKAVLDMQVYYGKSNTKNMKTALQSYEEEFEYIDDILKLNSNNKNIIIAKILNDFIVPFIHTAIIDDQMVYSSPICKRIGLCLLSKLLESITDLDMNECIMRIVLNKQSMPIDIKLKQHRIDKSLLLILSKEKTNIDTLLVLKIFHSLQTYILKTSKSSLGEFYHKFLFASMKLLKTNYQSSRFMECFKLKLLISILQPLTQRNNTCDSNYTKVKDLFFHNLEILYEEIRAKIRQKIVVVIDIIDEEYEAFIDIKVKRSKIFTDLNFSEDHHIVNKIVDNTKLELYNLFCLRCLYFKFKGEVENCLPMIKKKEEIGEIVTIDNIIKCEKLIGDTFYHREHYVKLTDRQLLILQSTENKTEGIIIFNSYYKDIIFSVDKNDLLKLCDITNTSSSKCHISSKIFFIHVKFTNSYDLKFVIDTLIKAKETQIKTVKRKLEKILLM